MANYVRFGSGFNITTNSAIDKRFVLSKAEMLTAEDVYNLPTVYFALCTTDRKMYIYDANSTPNSETGRYHLLEEYLDFGSSEKSVEIINDAIENSEAVSDINIILNGDPDIPEDIGLVDKVQLLEDTIEELAINGGLIE